VSAEQRANDIVLENRPVTVTFEDATRATGLRKPSDREGEIRVVSIDGVDRSACGGTHVRTTGEIGPCSSARRRKVRGGMRVEFLLRHSRTPSRAARLREPQFSRGRALGVDRRRERLLSPRQSERLKDAESTRRKLDKELAGFRAQSLYANARTVVERCARRRHRHRVNPAKSLRNLALGRHRRTRRAS
jgi:alanyl-tRNA synthetase